jgi:tetratricopeptide (TPR) repeat protein
MLSVAADEAARILEQLVELHLLEVSGVPGRYRMHDLLRLYSRDLATRIDSAPDRDATVQRAYTWYLTAVAEVNHSINGTRSDQRDTTAPSVLQLDSPADAIDWLDAELGTLVALAAQAAERPELLGSWLTQVTPLVAVILQKRGRWHEARRLATLSVATARKLNDQNAESMALRSLATCNWRAGRFDEAEENLRRSLRLIQLTGDVEGEARAIHNLGWLFHRMGRLPDAIEQLGRSIELVKDLEPPSWLGMGLHNLGEAYAQAGEHHQAMEYLERSLVVRRQQGDIGGLSITLVALGRAYGQLGRHQEALEMLAEGLQVCRQVGNREDEWVALLMKSELLLRMRRAAEAEPAVLQALAISRRLRNPHGEAAGERQLGKVLRALGRSEEAEAAQQRFKVIFADLPSSDDLLEQFLTDKDHQAANAGALHSPTPSP